MNEVCNVAVVSLFSHTVTRLPDHWCQNPYLDYSTFARGVSLQRCCVCILGHQFECQGSEVMAVNVAESRVEFGLQ